GGGGQRGAVVGNATVGAGRDAGRQGRARKETDGPCSELEQACLPELLQVLPAYDRIWCSAMTGKTFHVPTMNWNAVFAGSRCSIAASVAARIGTAICYATAAASLMRPGGSKMRSIDSNWS